MCNDSDDFNDLAVIDLITFNVHGLKSNLDYVKQLLRSFRGPLIMCISEHWLFKYDCHSVFTLFSKFDYCGVHFQL